MEPAKAPEDMAELTNATNVFGDVAPKDWADVSDGVCRQGQAWGQSQPGHVFCLAFK